MKRRLHTLLRLLGLSALLAVSAAYGQETAADGGALSSVPDGVIDPGLVKIAYSGGEKFRYDISYTGGVKLGELHIELNKSDDVRDGYAIVTRVTTENGLFENFYPIEDLHVTQVAGPERLPYYYEVWQQEGRNYRAHRVTRYEQQTGKIFYQVNDNPVEVFDVGAPTQNEFSSFFASRVMVLEAGKPFIVPTFADDKRIEVVVTVKTDDLLEKTVLGTVATKVVEPIMTFSGLYDKRGDTVIWYTDDECRVPVLINSKILIGSLTARLVAYANPACPRYDGSVLDEYREEISRVTQSETTQHERGYQR